MNTSTTVGDFLGSEEVYMRGFSLQKYEGKIYPITHFTFDLKKDVIVCITNSKKNDLHLWQHKLIRAFKPEVGTPTPGLNCAQNATHFIIIILGNVWSTVDDLEEIRKSPDWA